jgi:hypothetical protein
MEKAVILGIVSLFVCISSSYAQKSKGNVLDFNASVIEGELKRPQLFLELGTDIKDYNSVLLQRDDFNDFHALDMKQRLKYIE